MSILMKFVDYVHNDCSLYFDGRLNEVQLLHTYSTRHNVSGRQNLPVTSKSRCGDSFFVQTIKAWNELPQSIRETDVFKYKRLIKSHLFLTMWIGVEGFRVLMFVMNVSFVIVKTKFI